MLFIKQKGGGKMSQLAKDIAEYLKEFHDTEAEAIKSRDLSLMYNLTDNRHVRNIVTFLRQEGEPICSSSNGYWYSKDPADVEKTIRRMEGQVKNMNISIMGLRKALEEVRE
jgi:hypothetical protein